ncbi:uncharacterized protein EV422DRAFT_491688 [Fimicolochytrium jonesii]|uniref:uncharacterized protein n=1 Tax=Fimicolochytrium jonesii TaxID=1396493 RepID=UPI0022FE1C29|nr:uncharacterized protein EV422DRAFT_491688 [Fimicolochytrium jonesii]KAI8826157.1 hypothetical protein EV422DRAFT_491688 [Fimicolochytrium jonesii]
MSDEDIAPGSDVEQEVLDDEPKSILLGIIGQLRKGGDLSRVTLPTFVLEPRSMTERITDFMSHPELINNAPLNTDPVGRFADVVAYFLSGWHIKPKGVKKPYNPVLGEFFRCRWDFEDGSTAYYVCEQVSHHPPVSVYFYANPQNDIWISGHVRPASKFLGNSAATLMRGTHHVQFKRSWPGEEYTVTLPNVYARGILFGSMYLELGDSVVLKCPKNDLVADIDFQTKGFFTGVYNGVKGRIKRESSGEVIYNIAGKWTDSIQFTKASTSEKKTVFNAATAQIHTKVPPAEDAQEEFEARKLWERVTKGITTKNLDYATKEKTAIEDNQRVILKERAAKGVTWQPRFFTGPVDDDWSFGLKE